MIQSDNGKLKRGKRRMIIIAALSGIGLVCLALVVALFLFLQSPAALHALASVLGYEISADAVSLSPGLSGRIEELRITDPKSGFTITCSDVTIKNSLLMLLTGRIDSLVLQNPKLTLQKSKSSNEKTDLSFLQKLPAVHLLEIKNAEVSYLAGDEPQLALTGFHLTVKDFSPRTGGQLSLASGFSYTAGSDTRMSARGKVKAAFRLTGLYPRPYGKGTLDLVLDSGQYESGAKIIMLRNLLLGMKLNYDKNTETVTVEATGKHAVFGQLKAVAKTEVNDSLPWSVNATLSAIDVGKAFAALQSMLAKDAQGWTMRGTAKLEAALQGAYTDKHLTVNSRSAVSFRNMGISSPDSSISAQGITGSAELKLQYAASDRKLLFSLTSRQQHGEQLWKEYYNNAHGKKASIAADGHVFLTQENPFSLNATLDLFQTGEYAVSIQGAKDDWLMKASALQISHAKLIDTLLKEYVNNTSGRLQGLTANGSSSLEASVQRKNGTTTVSGVFRMADAFLKAPALELSIARVFVDLPFDLTHPSSARQKPSTRPPGRIRFGNIQQKKLSIENLAIPITITQNTVEVPERVVIPFYSGTIHLYAILADDILSPDMRVRFGLKVENLNLGRLTQRLLKMEFPGRVNADFGVMTYQKNGLQSQGTAVVNVFDGEITATNFFARNITLPSRSFGGDITMKNINLEEVTKKIAIGKMSGILEGSLTGFAMEYGQPSSFVLELGSIEKPGISQTISADAINTISILGTGAGSVLSQGVTKYFKEYPYSKIGIRCVLQDDQFTVNGTIIEGETEYLVRRGFLRGVDVVNQNRNNAISFRDMGERLQRISHHEQAAPADILLQ